MKNTHTYMHNTKRTIQTDSPAVQRLETLVPMLLILLVTALWPLVLWGVV